MSECNPFALTGKTVLVTGASSGIGRATAVECSRLGAKLVVTGRNAERLRATFDLLEGEGHRQILADLTSDGDLAKLVDGCPALDGIVLCAGVLNAMPLALASKARFAENFDVNFNAPVECLRLLFKTRKIADAASVVFVSSLAGMSGGTAIGEGVYGASKAALTAIVRYYAREFASRRIRFNSVNPGEVNTPLADSPIRKLGADARNTSGVNRYPLGRRGEPEDISHGIVYLLSDASSWVTGVRLVIDGGLTT